jgi:hypothetical protein
MNVAFVQIQVTLFAEFLATLITAKALKNAT